MSNASSSALAQRSAHTSLMPPPPAPKRIKRPAIVLDEDTYTSAVAHIIRRDFFPGLAEADAQRDYLNALESKDNTWIREAGKKLTQVMTPVPGDGKRRKVDQSPRVKARLGRDGALGRTPLGKGGETPGWVADTPRSLHGEDRKDENEEEREKPQVDLSLSLSAFQSKYISEDQESFSQLIDAQNAKKFARNEWLQNGNRFASKQRVAQQKLLASKSDSSEGKELILRPSQDLDDRPAAPTFHNHVAFNTLMFSPDSIEDWAPTRSQTAENASLAPPKATLYHNTRLPTVDPSTTNDIRPPSPTMSAVRDSIHGKPRLSQSEAGYIGSETPRVNGYAFVNAEVPQLEDEEEAPRDLLEKFDVKADPSPFTIHESQRREKLHHKMVERIGSKKPAKETSFGSDSSLGLHGNNTPRFLSAPTPRPGTNGAAGGKKNLGNLTPAAQRLFEKVGGGTPKPGNRGFGKANAPGREWAPTPKVKRRI